MLGLVGVVVVGSALVDVTPSTRGLLATAASVAVIAGLYAAPSGPAARLLALPVPRFLGQISYGTYLWHWPVILVVAQLFDVGSFVLRRSRLPSPPAWPPCPTRSSSDPSARRPRWTGSAGRWWAPGWESACSQRSS